MVTREELHRMVWSMSVSSIGRRLGVSDAYVKRICVALNVPRPDRAWWVLNRAGIPSPVVHLPPAHPGLPDAWSRGVSFDAPIRTLHRRATIQSEKGYHPLVEYTDQMFSRSPVSLDGTHLVSRSYNVIDLTVSADHLTEALTVANALFREMEKRGHYFEIPRKEGFTRPPLDRDHDGAERRSKRTNGLWRPRLPTVVTIKGMPLGVAILETVGDVEMRYIGGGKYVSARLPAPPGGVQWTEWRALPTGRFKLVLYSPRSSRPWQQEWRESKKSNFVRKVRGLASELEEAAANFQRAGLPFLNKSTEEQPTST